MSADLAEAIRSLLPSLLSDTAPAAVAQPAHGRSLEAIRVEIDAIDAAMHGLLMRRGAIIEEVLEAKRRAGDIGSAFRPAREAALMRSLVERHRGALPIDAPEGIWRIILASSTHMQVPYAVHADVSGGDAAMRDSVRFHFGFTVPFRPQPDALGVIAGVAHSEGDLGVFRPDQSFAAGAWWQDLEAPPAPKIIARLPFIRRPDHPAPMPVFVIARPQNEGLARETVVASVALDRWRPAAGAALAALGAAVEASAGTASGASLLVSHPAGVSAGELTAAFDGAKCAPLRYREVGCYAAPFTPAR